MEQLAAYIPPLPQNRILSEVFSSLRLFFSGKLFMWLCFFLGGILISVNAEVACAILFVAVISIILTVCDDIVPTTLPFLIICIAVLQCYDSFDTFIGFWWMAIPAVGSLVFHFIYYRRPIIIGKTFYGIAAVAVAVSFGGLGSIYIGDYLRSAYYTVGLGVGMLAAYVLIKSQISIERNYDLRERFVDIMYIAGLFACFRLFEIYVENYINLADRYTFAEFFNLRTYIGVHMPDGGYIPCTVEHVSMLQSGNNISTFLMMAMPFPFYRALKGGRNLLHLAVGAVMLGFIFLSDSRGGMLFGCVELIICLVAFSLMAKHKSSKLVGWGSLAAIVVIAAVSAFAFDAFSKFRDWIEGFKAESRGQLAELSIKEFKEAPVFGKGLGNPNVSEIYNGKKGTMQWYHMMIPQIIGSMGVVGIAGYGYQIFTRVRETALRFSPYVMTLFLSYLGVLLMTQVNPGEFCPLPYELMVVMLFILIEKEPARVKIKIKGEIYNGI